MTPRSSTLILSAVAFFLIFGLGYLLDVAFDTIPGTEGGKINQFGLFTFEPLDWLIWSICGIGWLLVILLITYPEKLNRLVEHNTQELAKANQRLIAEIIERGKIEQTLEEIQLGIGSNHIFEVVMPSDYFIAYIDEKLLRQILTNLLTNAIKYSTEGSIIQFYFEIHAHNFTFRISDHGIGIPVDDQAHLFHPFHRAKNVQEIVGTGLGLAIVKKCLDLHNGWIILCSDEGFGATFEITLPIVVESDMMVG